MRCVDLVRSGLPDARGHVRREGADFVEALAQLVEDRPDLRGRRGIRHELVNPARDRGVVTSLVERWAPQGSDPSLLPDCRQGRGGTGDRSGLA